MMKTRTITATFSTAWLGCISRATLYCKLKCYNITGSAALNHRATRCGSDVMLTPVTIPRMPTVLRSGPYRFYFYSHEPNEPPHIHVDRDDSSAKFWLDTVQLAANFGFRAHELREIQLLVTEHRTQLLETWNEFFSIGGR